MHEILDGIYHWTAVHEEIHISVHSYYIEATDPAVVIDPMTPAEGVGWFETTKPPEHIYLTNRLHYRHCRPFVQAFGAEVRCHRAGLHEFTAGEAVKAFEHGDELPGGILALKVGVLCPEETALYIPLSGGVLALGDAIVRFDNDLGFVPDYLMGEDPEAVKKGLREVFLDHLDREFDHLLFAHGHPWIGGAKLELRRFLEG